MAARKIEGTERASLVKLLADDRKIRGISLVTGCCMCPPPPFLLQMFCVSLFSVKLSLSHNAACAQVFLFSEGKGSDLCNASQIAN